MKGAGWTHAYLYIPNNTPVLLKINGPDVCVCVCRMPESGLQEKGDKSDVVYYQKINVLTSQGSEEQVSCHVVSLQGHGQSAREDQHRRAE